MFPVEYDVIVVVTGSLCFAVFERYKSYSPYDIKESIRKEVKGDLEKSFLTLGNAAENSLIFSEDGINGSSSNVSSQWSASRTDNSTLPTDSVKP